MTREACGGNRVPHFSFPEGELEARKKTPCSLSSRERATRKSPCLSFLFLPNRSLPSIDTRIPGHGAMRAGQGEGRHRHGVLGVARGAARRDAVDARRRRARSRDRAFQRREARRRAQRQCPLPRASALSPSRLPPAMATTKEEKQKARGNTASDAAASRSQHDDGSQERRREQPGPRPQPSPWRRRRPSVPAGRLRRRRILI